MRLFLIKALGHMTSGLIVVAILVTLIGGLIVAGAWIAVIIVTW